MHAAKELWHRHHPLSGYPAGVLAVPQAIPGIAFFPGGYGLWRPDISLALPAFPVGGVMVLGHDFHSEAGYLASLARTREAATQPTWRALTEFLGPAGVPVNRCFFTNVYMGLRAGSKASTFRHSSARCRRICTTGPVVGGYDTSTDQGRCEVG
jgi:hypothetical protein